MRLFAINNLSQNNMNKFSTKNYRMSRQIPVKLQLVGKKQMYESNKQLSTTPFAFSYTNTPVPDI